jgi:hypothetical protein
MVHTTEYLSLIKLAKEGEALLMRSRVLLADAHLDIIEGATGIMNRQMELYNVRHTELRGDAITDLMVTRDRLSEDRAGIMRKLYD